MIRARSVAGPLRRAHPASGATWNVQVVRGKMSSQCLWHACRALSAGLLLMLLGAAMAVIGYYADTLSVAQEIRGNATVSVKDEARGFHLNNLSYAGPIVMGFGGFIVVAACVMTFEARDSAAKVTPARPTAMPRPVARRGPPCASAVPPPGARLDALGVYRLPHVLPPLPLAPVKRTHHKIRSGQLAGAAGDARANARGGGRHARYGSAPDLRAAAAARTPLSATALRRPLRRYALSVDEPPHSTLSASAAESECGSQSSLALEVHCGAAAGSTLRVRDNTRRRRPLARQPRLRDDPPATPRDSCSHIHNLQDDTSRTNEDVDSIKESIEQLSQCDDGKISPRVEVTPPMSPRLLSPRTTSPHALDTCILIEEPSEIEDLPEVEEPPEIEEPEPPDQ